jgi:hypothetical protein
MAGTDLRGGQANGKRTWTSMKMLEKQLMADRSNLILSDRPEDRSLPSVTLRQALRSLTPLRGAWLATLLMEIMRCRGGACFRAGQGFEVGHVDRRHVSLGALDPAMHHQIGFGGDEQLIVLEGFFWHKKVGDSHFILQGNETMPLRRRWPLAADGKPCDAGEVPVFQAVEIGRGFEVAAMQ